MFLVSLFISTTFTHFQSVSSFILLSQRKSSRPNDDKIVNRNQTEFFLFFKLSKEKKATFFLRFCIYVTIETATLTRQGEDASSQKPEVSEAENISRSVVLRVTVNYGKVQFGVENFDMGTTASQLSKESLSEYQVSPESKVSTGKLYLFS